MSSLSVMLQTNYGHSSWPLRTILQSFSHSYQSYQESTAPPRIPHHSQRSPQQHQHPSNRWMDHNISRGHISLPSSHPKKSRLIVIIEFLDVWQPWVDPKRTARLILRLRMTRQSCRLYIAISWAEKSFIPSNVLSWVYTSQLIQDFCIVFAINIHYVLP